MATPSAPPSGPGGPGIGGGITVDQITMFIKGHYLEIFIGVILVYLSYYAIVAGSKYIFKPAYIVDPNRGSKRCIGRTMYSKVVMGDNKYEEFRAYIKDGLRGPVVPHLFADMDRVKILSNAILLDFRSVVYDHDRKMFVGSHTGVKDMDMDGLAVEQRVKEKLAMIDVGVSLAVRGSPSIAQYNMMNNAIPLPDGYYEEDIQRIGRRGTRGFLPPHMRRGDVDVTDLEDEELDRVNPENLDHVNRVIYEKEIKKRRVRKIKRRASPVRKQRFVVGEPEEPEQSPEKDFEVPEETFEGPSSFISSMESMSLSDKIKGMRATVEDVED